MSRNFDVLIVGASVAGASLALRLAKRGVKTAVVDKSSFPRRKACGEGLSDVAMEKLSELDLGEKLSACDHTPFYGYCAWLGNFSVDLASNTSRKGSPDKKPPKGVGIQRYVLDELLVRELSEQSSVETFFGQKIAAVKKDGGEYVVEVSDGALRARHLVLADGANSLLASRLEIPRKAGNSPSWGISWIFEGEFTQPAEQVSVFVKKGYEIYCTPVGNNRVNVCILARKHLISELSRPENALPEIIQAFEKIGFAGAPIGKPEHIGPIASTRRPIVHDGILLAGDACESLDPISGMGMTHALLTSELVANALVAILCDQKQPHVVFRELIKRRESTVRPYRGFARLTGMLLRGTRNHGRLLALLARTPFPSKVRDVLCPELLGTQMPSSASAVLLALAGFDFLYLKGF